jgi:uncharacterized protein YraI
MKRTARWASRLAGVFVLVLAANLLLPAGPAGAAVATGYVHVAGGSTVNIRSGPSTTFPVVWLARDGSPVQAVCQTVGLRVAGSVRLTSMWDRLTNGRYVSDAYVVWPGGGPRVGLCTLRATVRVAGTVNVRANTSTLKAPVGVLPNGTPLAVLCQLDGETAVGPVRTTSLWDRLTNGRYVSDAFVVWPGARPAVPWCILSSGVPPPAGSPFVSWASGYARITMRLYRVPASVTLAQAILESGWGRSDLTVDGNSYFGMKCFGTPGYFAAGCRTYRTFECGSSGCYSTSASFRVYWSIWASFRDHAYLLATLPRYRNAFRYVNNPNRFAIEIHRAGYATSPSYAQHLIQLMQMYNLYQYDVGVLT